MPDDKNLLYYAALSNRELIQEVVGDSNASALETELAHRLGNVLEIVVEYMGES